jgi:hypothetical protein
MKGKLFTAGVWMLLSGSLLCYCFMVAAGLPPHDEHFLGKALKRMFVASDSADSWLILVLFLLSTASFSSTLWKMTTKRPLEE